MADTITQETRFVSEHRRRDDHPRLYLARRGLCQSPRYYQVAHGAAEYIERYDDFARFLASKGFIVGGYDHLAHGESVSQSTSWGELDPRHGANHLIRDVHRMRSYMLAHTPTGLPYFVFGHSMAATSCATTSCAMAMGLPVPYYAARDMSRLSSRRPEACYPEPLPPSGKGYESCWTPWRRAATRSSMTHARKPIGFRQTRKTSTVTSPTKSGFMFPPRAAMRRSRHSRARHATPRPSGQFRRVFPCSSSWGTEDPVGSMGERRQESRRNGTRSRCKGRQGAHLRGNAPRNTERKGMQAVYDDVLTWLDGHLSGGAR